MLIDSSKGKINLKDKSMRNEHTQEDISLCCTLNRQPTQTP
jgi:hypothetical protein